MKFRLLTISLFLLISVIVTQWVYAGPKAKTVEPKAYHVVVIWLKKHGDEKAIQQYIEGSKRLSKLPGILAYNIGTPAHIKRNGPAHALEDSYDIAVSSTFESKQALENYLNHPEHHKVVQEVLKPLVARYKAYDFSE